MPAHIKKIKWRILGAACITENAVIPAMSRSEHCRPLAVAARDEGRVRRMAGKLNVVRACGSNDALFADPEVDAVYIALPNHLHGEWVHRVASAGKHLLVEKPIAMTAAELDQLASLPSELKIAEAFVVRHQLRWQALAGILRSGEFGTPRTVSSLLSFTMTKEDGFRTRPEWGGGAIYDLGYYTAMACRFAFAELCRVFAGCDRDSRGIDMISSVILDFGDRRHGVFSVSLAQASAQSLDIVCEKASIQLPKTNVPSRTESNFIHIVTSADHAKPVMTLRSFAALDQYEAEVANFLRDMAGLDAPFYGLDDARDDARANMKVVDAIFASARIGSWVEVARSA